MKRGKINKNRRPKAAKYNLSRIGNQTSTRGPQPDAMSVVLTYQDPDWIYGNSGNTVWSQRFRMNSVFDPDPDVLSGGNLSYFPQYAALYEKYRVTRLSYHITFVNQTDSAIVVSVAPTRDDLGSNYANAEEFGELAYGRSSMVGPVTGVNSMSFRGSIDLAKFSGYKGYLTDDITASSVLSNPTHMYYLNMAVNTSVSQTSTSFAVRTILKYHVTFFERNNTVISNYLRRPVSGALEPPQEPNCGELITDGFPHSM